MILNSQNQIDDMNNEFLSIMIIEFLNWLCFDQSQRFNLQLITNNLRNYFINEWIVSSFNINQWLQWVTNFIARNRLIALSWVLEFKSNTWFKKYQVELKFFEKSVELNWEVELENLNWVEKLDLTTRLDNSIQLDKILNKCK